MDDESNERIRGAAQGFIAFILWGVGNFVGSTLAGKSQAYHTLKIPMGNIAHDWHGIWMYPAWGSVVVLALFVIFFRESRGKSAPELVASRKEEELQLP